MFQSAPVIADGRATAIGAADAAATVFQSAPVIADGRALLGFMLQHPHPGFNPRPSSLTGEPLFSTAGPPLMWVFQSAPVIADGRAHRRLA